MSIGAWTLQQLVEMEAESLELSFPRGAHATSALMSALDHWNDVVEAALDRLVALHPPGNVSVGGPVGTLMRDGEAAYLILMTKRGEGVGIWDGSWDKFYLPADVRRFGAVYEFITDDNELDGAFYHLEDALRDAAMETGGHIPFPERDWRDVEPITDGFIYAADLWCYDCGRRIRKQLTAQGRAPADPDDEYSYDSDDFPKEADVSEQSDSVQHCASDSECLDAITLPGTEVTSTSGPLRIGAWLGNTLTSHGTDVLCQDLEEMPGNVVKLVVGALHAYLYREDLKTCQILPAYVNPRAYFEPGKVAAELPAKPSEEVVDDILGLLGMPGAEHQTRARMRAWGLPEDPLPWYGGVKPGPPRMLATHGVWTDKDRADYVAAVERGYQRYEAYGVPRERVKQSIVASREQRPRLREGYDYNPAPNPIYSRRSYEIAVAQRLDPRTEIQTLDDAAWVARSTDNDPAVPASSGPSVESMLVATTRLAMALDQRHTATAAGPTPALVPHAAYWQEVQRIAKRATSVPSQPATVGQWRDYLTGAHGRAHRVSYIHPMLDAGRAADVLRHTAHPEALAQHGVPGMYLLAPLSQLVRGAAEWAMAADVADQAQSLVAPYAPNGRRYGRRR